MKNIPPARSALNGYYRNKWFGSGKGKQGPTTKHKAPPMESLDWFSCGRFLNNYDVIRAKLKSAEHWRDFLICIKNE